MRDIADLADPLDTEPPEWMTSEHAQHAHRRYWQQLKGRKLVTRTVRDGSIRPGEGSTRWVIRPRELAAGTWGLWVPGVMRGGEVSGADVVHVAGDADLRRQRG